MTGTSTLPGGVVWQEDAYAATIIPRFLGYDSRLYWLNDYSGLWHDQSFRLRAKTFFIFKASARSYANNELRDFKTSLDLTPDVALRVFKSHDLNFEDKVKAAQILRKLK